MRVQGPFWYSLALCALLVPCLVAGPPPDETHAAYLKARDLLKHEEEAMNPASLLKLSPEEVRADQYLQQLKRAEVERTKGNFPPAMNFILAKKTIDGSALMPVFRQMPKGGILHVHPGSIQDLHWLIATATYRPDCYVQRGPGPGVEGQLAFFPRDPGGPWRRVQELRAAAPDAGRFDEGLYQSLTLGPEDLAGGEIWREFERCWSRLGRFLDNPRIYEAFGKRELEAAVADHVQLVELRASLNGPSRDEGGSDGPEEAIRLYRAWERDLQTRHPEFQLRVIYSRERVAAPPKVAEYLARALALRKAHPRFVMGFDLVNEEDRSHPLLDFLDPLLAATAEARREGLELPYFFHAGESNWTPNENTLDAILLGSRRIGHGLALIKHPRLLQLVKERDIAIEVCPVSNQVLGYVADLRNHPAVNWLRSGIPIVLSPDDPGIMQGGFAYDFYEAFMAWDLDLRDLKQLILNSIKYSTLEPEARAELLQAWQGQWATFILWLDERAKPTS